MNSGAGSPLYRSNGRNGENGEDERCEVRAGTAPIVTSKVGVQTISRRESSEEKSGSAMRVRIPFNVVNMAQAQVAETGPRIDGDATDHRALRCCRHPRSRTRR